MKGNYSHKILLYKIKSLDDAESYGKLYDLYVDRIYRFIFFKVSVKEDAQDLTSEVFLKTWQYIKEKDKIDNFNAFIYQIARNIVIDYYRKISVQNVISDEKQLENIQDSFSEKLLNEVNINIEMTQVLIYLNKLKDEYREVILLRYIEGYSIKEIDRKSVV